MVQQIPLIGKQGTGKFALVDDEDFEWAKQYRWYLSSGYARRGQPITTTDGKTKQTIVVMHRVILERMGIDMSGQLTDHINGERSDNRRSNLRPATSSQNLMNRRAHQRRIPKTSSYKGVFAVGSRWHAVIGVNKRRIHLGYFASELDAARAYNAAAVQYHGEFAVLNDVPVIQLQLPLE